MNCFTNFCHEKSISPYSGDDTVHKYKGQLQGSSPAGEGGYLACFAVGAAPGYVRCFLIIYQNIANLFFFVNSYLASEGTVIQGM